MPEPATSSPSPAPSSGITLCAIATVLIRILAIRLGLYTVSSILATYATIWRPKEGPLLTLLFLAICLLCAYWLWQASSFLARCITRGLDSTFSACAVNLHDLYCFAFVFVGLQCVTEALGPSLTWLHYALSQSGSSAALSEAQKGNFYTLFKYLVRLILGLAFIFQARKFATKLTKRSDTDPSENSSNP